MRNTGSSAIPLAVLALSPKAIRNALARVKFPAETPAMCVRDPGMVTKAIMEMVTVGVNSAFKLAENIIKFKEHGVDADSLSSTIQVFIDLGKPFANPICPVPNATASN